MARFQVMISAIITIIAFVITLLRTLLAEREAKREKGILTEMKEVRIQAKREEDERRQKEMKKWEEGEDWPIGEGRKTDTDALGERPSPGVEGERGTEGGGEDE